MESRDLGLWDTAGRRITTGFDRSPTLRRYNHNNVLKRCIVILVFMITYVLSFSAIWICEGVLTLRLNES